MVGRTRYCQRCNLRFAGGAVCPECGVLGVVSAARDAKLRGERRWWAWPLVVAPIVISIPVAVVVALGSTWGLLLAIGWLDRLGSGWALLPQIPLMFAIIAALIVGFALPLSLGIIVSGDVDAALPRAHPVRTAAAPDGERERGVEQGVVRCAQPLVAPLSRVPCAAFELRTSGPTGVHRDAVATELVLETSEGTTLRVEPGPGSWLDLPAGERLQLRRDRRADDHAELRELCRNFGLGGELDALSIEERVLPLGARVEVRGGVRTTAPSDDYRGTAVLAIEPSPTAPIVIRVVAN